MSDTGPNNQGTFKFKKEKASWPGCDVPPYVPHTSPEPHHDSVRKTEPKGTPSPPPLTKKDGKEPYNDTLMGYPKDKS